MADIFKLNGFDYDQIEENQRNPMLQHRKKAATTLEPDLNHPEKKQKVPGWISFFESIDDREKTEKTQECKKLETFCLCRKCKMKSRLKSAAFCFVLGPILREHLECTPKGIRACRELEHLSCRHVFSICQETWSNFGSEIPVVFLTYFTPRHATWFCHEEGPFSLKVILNGWRNPLRWVKG